MPVPDDLRALLVAAGPSGHEQPAAAVWRQAAASFAQVEVDSLGTSYARVAAADDDAPTLAIVAHIDEIGVQVTHIDEQGFVHFSTLGGIAAEVLAGQRVRPGAAPAAPVPGVVGRRDQDRRRRDEQARGWSSPTSTSTSVPPAPADARALSAGGDAGVWLGEPAELAAGRVASRALDNRLGAYAALEAARRVAAAGDARVHVVAVATVQEELGHHGARTAAFALEPQVALAIDVTWATDVPGGDPRRAGRVDLGSGASVTRGPVVNPRVCDLLVEAAAAESIPYSVEVYSGATHTDADDVFTARAGVPTGLVSIPLRYMHTPSELAQLDDLEAVVRLVAAFTRRLGPETSFLR